MEVKKDIKESVEDESHSDEDECVVGSFRKRYAFCEKNSSDFLPTQCLTGELEEG